MKKRHSFARLIVASGFALVSLLSVAASAAVSTDATSAPAHISSVSKAG